MRTETGSPPLRSLKEPGRGLWSRNQPRELGHPGSPEALYPPDFSLVPAPDHLNFPGLGRGANLEPSPLAFLRFRLRLPGTGSVDLKPSAFSALVPALPAEGLHLEAARSPLALSLGERRGRDGEEGKAALLLPWPGPEGTGHLSLPLTFLALRRRTEGNASPPSPLAWKRA
jgi:hypothetical protein